MAIAVAIPMMPVINETISSVKAVFAKSTYYRTVFDLYLMPRLLKLSSKV